jgi:hypothetical protein
MPTRWASAFAAVASWANAVERLLLWQPSYSAPLPRPWRATLRPSQKRPKAAPHVLRSKAIPTATPVPVRRGPGIQSIHSVPSPIVRDANAGRTQRNKARQDDVAACRGQSITRHRPDGPPPFTNVSGRPLLDVTRGRTGNQPRNPGARRPTSAATCSHRPGLRLQFTLLSN